MTATIRPLTTHSTPDDTFIGSCSLRELAHTYGTPLYILDQATISHQCQQFTHTLNAHYPHYTVAYASKAGLTIGLCELMAKEGLGADVVSGGELYTVLKSSISRDAIYFHGNNKSPNELTLAIKNNCRIVVDNAHELAMIQSIAESLDQPALLLFRIKPGIEAHTHEYIKTGHNDSKFGLLLSEAIPFIRTVLNGSWGQFLGIHAHIGSQIFDTQPYQDLVRILVSFMTTIRQETGAPITELNAGGGFGIAYTSSDQPTDIATIVKNMAVALTNECQSANMPLPKLIFEPGRSIIATAGVTLYTVGATKSIENGPHYVFVDGGMADNPRPMMYQSKYTIEKVPPLSTTTIHYDIAGKFCESGDIIAKQVPLPLTKPNDHIVVYGTGAYNYSMASNYNRFCKPAMVLVHNGTASLLVKRETYDDIIQHDIV